MSEFIRDRVEEYDVVVGDKKAEDQGYIGFINTVKALEMLRRHIKGNKPIVVHTDIDVDGVGNAYIMQRFLLSQGVLSRTGFVINKEKEHGILDKHVDYFNNVGIGLLIILDSSCNEIERIKRFNCDVLIVDHHELLHNELSGRTASGEYVVVTNMVENNNVEEINKWISQNNGKAQEYVKEYKVDSRMSCGVVLYELLRIYAVAYDNPKLLENMMLYQWVGVTLFTDAVLLSNARNQYYIENTVFSMDIEPTLKILMSNINGYQVLLDKSFINYSLAPIINKAIRAGQSGQVLDIVLNRPKDILQLNAYKEAQQKVIDQAMTGVQLYDTFALKDISNTDIHRNYCGVLAAKICDETKKNTVVFIVDNGIAIGSFRGRVSGADYRRQFERFGEGIYAQGHKTAFGFKVKLELLGDIMRTLPLVESGIDTRPYVTAGNSIPSEYRGKYHIESIDNFKRQGLLWKLAVANAKLSSDEAIHIQVSINDITFIEQQGKVYWYNILGLRSMAFEVLNTPFIDIYIEYSRDIKIYAKNIK